jgi:hypothetical protein
MKSAIRNTAKLFQIDAPVIVNIPVAISMKEKTMDFLYPFFIMIKLEGNPNSTKAEKVAVVTRYDLAVLILNADFKKGIKKALMPVANPNTANMVAMIIIGIIKAFHLF